MIKLFPEKHVTIITSDVLEKKIITYIKAAGAGGYTIVRARGAGSNGEQSGLLDVDTNIKILIVLSPDKLSGLLDSMEKLQKKGHHFVLFVTDVMVMSPEKFE
jgi:nitrogen regulatory protein PII